LLVDFCDLVFW